MRLVLIERTMGVWHLVRAFERPWKAVQFWAGRFSHPDLCVVTVLVRA